MGKKGEIVWEHIVNIILVLALVIVLLLGVYFLRNYLHDLWDKVVEFLRFGG